MPGRPLPLLPLRALQRQPPGVALWETGAVQWPAPVPAILPSWTRDELIPVTNLGVNPRMRLPLSAAALRIARRLRLQVPKPEPEPEPKRERSAAAKLAAKLAAKRRGKRANPTATAQPKPKRATKREWKQEQPGCRELDGLAIQDSVNLDATKDRGYWARENGRYGSHPSHDRFDGDSEP